MANKKLQMLDEITPKRVVALVIVLAVLGVLIWVFSTQIKKLIGKMKAKTLIADEEAKGISASYSAAEYYAMAEKLFTAMNGPGTDKPSVLATYRQIKNDVDFLKLNEAFGTRGSSWFGLEKGDLNKWLRDEGDNLVVEVNQILAQNGVTKRYF